MGQQPVDWVLEKILPRGALCLLSAYPKTGKSTLVYPLAIAVSRGEPFLGFPTTRGGVLILAVEESLGMAATRAATFGLAADDPLWTHQGRLLQTEQVWADLKDFVVGNGISLLVLDTLSKWWDIEDENDNAEIIRATGPLLDLARSTGVCVLVVHHTTKAGGDGGREIRGGGALLGIVDQAIVMSKGKGDDTERVLRILGRYEDSPKELLIQLDDGVYRLLGEGEDAEYASRLERVKGELLKEQPLSVEELSGRCRLKPAVVRRALRALRTGHSGTGKKGDPLRYSLLTEEGEEEGNGQVSGQDGSQLS